MISAWHPSKNLQLAAILAAPNGSAFINIAPIASIWLPPIGPSGWLPTDWAFCLAIELGVPLGVGIRNGTLDPWLANPLLAAAAAAAEMDDEDDDEAAAAAATAEDIAKRLAVIELDDGGGGLTPPDPTTGPWWPGTIELIGPKADDPGLERLGCTPAAAAAAACWRLCCIWICCYRNKDRVDNSD